LSQATVIINCKFNSHSYRSTRAQRQQQAITVCLTVGGSFFISAAQCGFNNQLNKYFAQNLSELSPGLALSTSATEIRTAFTPEQVPIVIDAYITGVRPFSPSPQLCSASQLILVF
jgi:hypothetical protein